MKRLLLAAMGLYVGAALLSHLGERAGRYRCACRPDCWCKKPGISLFRWVFPFGHSLSRSG